MEQEDLLCGECRKVKVEDKAHCHNNVKPWEGYELILPQNIQERERSFWTTFTNRVLRTQNVPDELRPGHWSPIEEYPPEDPL